MPEPRPRAERLRTLLPLVALMVATSIAHGQERAPAQPQLRVDAIDVRSIREGTVHGGAGVDVPLGYYARLGVLIGGGITRRDDVILGSGRADVIARFLLDPFREARWGLSVGAGMTVGYIAGEDWREFLVVVLDVEAPPVRRRVVPAFQLGLGGGVRVGIVARPYRQGRR